MFLFRIIAEALGLGEERYEVFRKGDNESSISLFR